MEHSFWCRAAYHQQWRIYTSYTANWIVTGTYTGLTNTATVTVHHCSGRQYYGQDRPKLHNRWFFSDLYGDYRQYLLWKPGCYLFNRSMGSGQAKYYKQHLHFKTICLVSGMYGLLRSSFSISIFGRESRLDSWSGVNPDATFIRLLRKTKQVHSKSV